MVNHWFQQREACGKPGISSSGMGNLPAINQPGRSLQSNDRSPVQQFCRRHVASRECLALPRTDEPERHHRLARGAPRKAVQFVAAAALAACANSALAGEFATKDEAVAMVKKAVVFIKDQGAEKAYGEFSNKSGSFVDRDLYVVVYGLDGK